jgi:hypothetical protein
MTACGKNDDDDDDDDGGGGGYGGGGIIIILLICWSLTAVNLDGYNFYINFLTVLFVLLSTQKYTTCIDSW